MALIAYNAWEVGARPCGYLRLIISQHLVRRATWRAAFHEQRSQTMADRDPVLVSAVRTPIGRFLGGLSSFSATQLGSIAIREAIKRAGIDVADVDEVIMGNVVTAGEGQAPARQAALHGGIPADVPAVTINKVCGSGLKAVMLASQAIKAGDG